MVNAQEYINEKYPINETCITEEEDYYKNYGKRREEITNLDLHNLDLEGSLDLSDFVNLEELWCSNNGLISLKLNNCPSLKKIWCYDNKLTDLEIGNLTKLVYLDCRDNLLSDLSLSSKDLTYLTIRNNNLSERDLSMFSELVDLEVLYIGNDNSWNKDNQEKVNQEKFYNKFKGSLEPLEKLENLKELSISNTDIDTGLEYLPKNLEKFWYSTGLRKDAKVKKIEQALKGKLPAEIKKDSEELLSRSEDIRKNIHQFFEGYSAEEVKELKDPKQTEKYENFIWWTKMGGRIISLSGSALTFTGHNPMWGGVITTFYPFIEFGASTWEETTVKADQSKWEGFVKNSEKLWGDYRDLIEGLNFFKTWDNSPLEQWKNIKKLKEEKSNQTEQIAEKENRLKEKIGEKNYRLLPLWEKLQEIYKDNSEEGVLMTKGEFARDLWEYWEYKDKKEKRITGWGNDGRKTQWREIGEMLVRISKNRQVQGVEANNTDVVIDMGEDVQKNQRLKEVHETDEIENVTESTPLLKTQVEIPPKK